MTRAQLVSLAIAAVLATGCTGPVPTATPTVSTPPPPPLLSLTAGDCTGPIDFNSEPSAAAIVNTACDQQHYWEVHAVIPVEYEVYPGPSLLDTLAREDCAASFNIFVGVETENSRYTSSYLAPVAEGWSNPNNRVIYCLLGSPTGGLTSSAKGDTTIFPAQGQCTGPHDVPPLELKIIDCAQPHNWEVYAVKNLKNKNAPTPAELDKLVQENCKDKFEKFVGKSLAESKYVFAFFLADADTWKKIKDHRLVCTVGSSKGGISGTLKGVKK